MKTAKITKKNDVNLNQNSKIKIIQPQKFNSNSESGISTYLNDNHIAGFKRMFPDEEHYRYYMKTLWILRSLAGNACEMKGENGWFYDHSNPSFPIWKTMNNFIGALLTSDGLQFDQNGDAIKR